MMKQERVAIVGAGIFGLAHSWAAIKRNHTIHLFEGTRSAEGASIRNFGMIWPIGQPLGQAHSRALRSAELWRDLAQSVGLWLNQCGSLHLAHQADEMAVLEEFHQLSREHGIERRLLTPAQVCELTPAANPQGLQGGLFSPTEMGVDPPAAIGKITDWIRQVPAVTFSGSTTVCSVDGTGDSSIKVRTSDHQEFYFDRVLICSGSDIRSLFPGAYASSDIKLCKLQMMRTTPQPGRWRIGPHLASGLTLRHYPSFANCPSLSAVKSRVLQESPELDRFGIHVMASQTDSGEVILGDSHEYGEAIDPFDKSIIDELIVQELKKVFQFPNWSIGHRWHGIYAKNFSGNYWTAEPEPGVMLFNGLGGNGMTLALAIAEEYWSEN